ncbi:unnamed protein product [Ectocarpus sp. 12 AP-2014]
MRARAPPRSAGLLNGDYDKHGGKIARYNGGTLARLAAAVVALLAVWLVAMYAFSPASGEGGAMTASSPGWDGGESVARDSKKKHKHEDKGSRHKRHSHKHKQAGCTASPLQEKDAFPAYGCAELEEMFEGKTEFLGKGYWREVRLATYRGQDVAIKTLREDQEETDRNRERHRWEAVALDMVSDHPNIVHLLGLCECDMITEYFPYYMDVLLMGDDSSSEDLVELSIGEIIRMALQAARGIQALHEMPGGPVVHADLQPRQLLLDENGVVKVNDLNRCRFMARDSSGEPCPFYISKGNGVWRSPEEYAGEGLTEKLDIYSLGNIFWSMLGRKPPFARDGKYKARVLRGERPKVDPSWHPAFVQLFTDMWKRDPRERPTAREVVLRLERMYAELPPESESD